MHYYIVVLEKYTNEEAEAACASHGGVLVVFEYQEQYHFYQSVIQVQLHVHATKNIIIS